MSEAQPPELRDLVCEHGRVGCAVKGGRVGRDVYFERGEARASARARVRSEIVGLGNLKKALASHVATR